MKPKLILVGTGMAGTRFLENLLEEAPNSYEIEVFNKEPVGGYNRIMLSPVLAGEKTIPDIMTHDESWFEERSIRLHTGKMVSAIDSVGQVLTTFCGETYFYDKLVIATGSNPFKLEIPGADLPGVVTFREIRDVENMLSVSQHHNKAVVIGGGLLGLEAAHGLMKRGMDVTVIHRSEVLMNMQMDKESSQLLKSHLEQGSNVVSGMKFHLGVNTTEILGQHQVEGIRLDDGSEIATDLVVMSIGIRPNTQLAKQANLDVNRGILVNDFLETSAENVYALGECNEHRGQTYGLVAPLYEQAKILAKRLAGQSVSYTGSITSTMLKVTGVQLFSAGEFKGENGADVIVFRDLAKNIYRKIVLKNNQVIGALLFGDTTGANWLFELLRQKQNISPMRDTLVFGPGY